MNQTRHERYKGPQAEDMKTLTDFASTQFRLRQPCPTKDLFNVIQTPLHQIVSLSLSLTPSGRNATLSWLLKIWLIITILPKRNLTGETIATSRQKLCASITSFDESRSEKYKAAQSRKRAIYRAVSHGTRKQESPSPLTPKDGESKSNL